MPLNPLATIEGASKYLKGYDDALQKSEDPRDWREFMKTGEWDREKVREPVP